MSLRNCSDHITYLKLHMTAVFVKKSPVWLVARDAESITSCVSFYQRFAFSGDLLPI